MNSDEIIIMVTGFLVIGSIMGFAFYMIMLQYVPNWLASVIAIALAIFFALAPIIRFLRPTY